MTTTLNDRLHALLEPLAVTAGVDLEEVTLTKIGGSRVLDVVVDTDGGIDLDLVAELSRGISEVLDGPEGTAVLGDAGYRLEVGSPGAERLLTQPRHWRRAQSRLVKVQLSAKSELLGRVLEADDEGVLLEVQPLKGRVKTTERRLAYGEISKARVQVEFNRKDEDGTDDVDIEDVEDVDDIDGNEEEEEA
jgi:ribosome maturation factor RimP